ncbi:uncharacterized protein BKCO1_1220004 [Diplodia corticola]|uniref:TMEM205-like domain-containing protein n=1 Tax=Diplodia corticola TaxID=236234 RepID=A0A1J9RM44_9PEZI|nr:uncharacterized protein BKCO1_1220004 [Diplodia corticola]OJD28669.1 hypothetical protein BKCO1_1220004 [Diplodia corticola]
MPSLAGTLKTGAPYHLLSYGTLLGSTLFQSFIGGVIAFRALPRPQFAQLQSKTFPVYFAMQTALPVAMALTFPSRAASVGYGALDGALDGAAAGLLADVNRGALVAVAAMFVSGLVNLVYVGPATTACMRERKHQETRDGKKSYDAGPHSPEMQRLNKKFATLHGISSLTNLATFIAQLYYGVVLAQRL